MTHKTGGPAPGIASHTIQRGNLVMKAYLVGAYYLGYLLLTVEVRYHTSVQVWSLCLMPSQVNLMECRGWSKAGKELLEKNINCCSFRHLPRSCARSL